MSAGWRARAAGRGLRLLVSGALFVAGCTRTPADPVESLLAGLEQAVEARDAEAFARHLAPEFRGQGGLDRAGATAELRRYFALYESVAVERAPATVTRDGDATLVSLRVLFSAKPKLQERFGLATSESPPLRFDLRCREHEGALRVGEVAWVEETPPAE